ncbi:hypothetical protein AWB98_20635 [Mycolicibacterium conceptionense]|uniref:Enoyl-CoA hydratase n=1 Tax=Mycolicibacterium conceptionense TaxID=451644 RepID=A0ABX3V4C9_9MYCO|nr:hypothetical protein AWB98_20635 [Mycolicibacterium conceptionense]
MLIVRFNNPPHHFYDEQMSVEFDRLTRWIKRDKSIGAVVLTGQGTAYTHLHLPDLLEGAQLTPFGIPYRASRVLTVAAGLASRSRLLDRLLRKTPVRAVAVLARTTAALKRMTDSDKVFVAAINGNAVGFGCVIALACDIRLMADGDYLFGLPESEVSMFAGAGGSQRLVRMVGTSRASDMLFEGRLVGPHEAYEVGLVNRIAPEQHLYDQALAAAEHLAGRPAVLNREIKRALYVAGTRSLAAGIKMEAASMMSVVSARGAAASIKKLQDELDRSATDDTGEMIRTTWGSVVQSARRVSAG